MRVVHTKRLAGPIALIATLSAGAGCGSSSESPSAATTERSCRPAAAFKAGTTVQRLVVAGVERGFLVHMPSRPSAAMRLVVDFHGADSNMQQQAAYSGFGPVADRNNFVVATPNGIDATTREWRFLSGGSRDDLTFAIAIVQRLVREACVDPSHVYATGFSSGGAMTAWLACLASDTFAGFATVAANFYRPSFCDTARPRPIIIFHGTADALVPYNGGRIAEGYGLGDAPAEANAASWAKHNGCSPGPTRKRVGSEVVRFSWRGCIAPVVMYRIEGGGHSWPGAATVSREFGFTTHQVSATNEIWKFFSPTPRTR